MAVLPTDQRRRLDANPWFASLPAAVRDDMVARARIVEYGAGLRLFLRGDPADGWYGLVSGSLRVSNATRDGGCTVLTLIEPGTWVGDMALVDGGPRTHDVHAHADAVVLKIGRPDFDALFVAHPALARALLVRRVGTIRQLMAQFEASLTQPLEQRLAARMVMLVQAFGEAGQRGTRIELRLSQDTLAQMTGVSRPRINQAVADWSRRGLVEAGYGRLVVRDVGALEAVARGDATPAITGPPPRTHAAARRGAPAAGPGPPPRPRR